MVGRSFVELTERGGRESGRFLEHLAEMEFIGESALFRNGVEIAVGRDEKIFSIIDAYGPEQI